MELHAWVHYSNPTCVRIYTPLPSETSCTYRCFVIKIKDVLAHSKYIKVTGTH